MSELPLIDEELADDGGPDADLTPTDRRRTRIAVLSALGGVVLLVAIVIGIVAWRALSGPHTSLRTPSSIAGLTIDSSSDAKQTADYLRTAVAADVTLDSSVGAVYSDPAAKDRSVLFFGGTAHITNPTKQLDGTLASLLDDQGGGISGMRDIPAGQAGGVMKCGTSTGDGGPMTVCGWADSGSIAVALFPGRTVDQAATLMTQLRTGIETTH